MPLMRGTREVLGVRPVLTWSVMEEQIDEGF
jgi:hypothetical protein